MKGLIRIFVEGKADKKFLEDYLNFLKLEALEIIDVGGWGNPYVWLLDWLGLRYDRVPNANWHPLHKIALLNHRDCPITTWIVARK